MDIRRCAGVEQSEGLNHMCSCIYNYLYIIKSKNFFEGEKEYS